MANFDLDRIIEMFWEDRTPFEAIIYIYFSKIKRILYYYEILRSGVKLSMLKFKNEHWCSISKN